MSAEVRLPTRQQQRSDLPEFNHAALDPETRAALAELLLTIADDEFVIGFKDSEWTGIAPTLEEDVAFSSLAQDEIGHARLLYEMLAQLTGGDADEIAFRRQPTEYRQARLLDHPRHGWAFTITRRWLYETADAVRLAALSGASFKPLADVVAKIQREERYHLMHVDAWLRRLAARHGVPRGKILSALKPLAPDALAMFSPLKGEQVLLDAGVLAAPMVTLAERWRSQANAVLADLQLRPIPAGQPPADGRDRPEPSESFLWLWTEFTSVARLEEGVEW